MPLPEGLQFFKLGWWVIHVVAIYLVYQYAYRRGRRDGRREHDASRSRPPSDPPQNR